MLTGDRKSGPRGMEATAQVASSRARMATLPIPEVSEQPRHAPARSPSPLPPPRRTPGGRGQVSVSALTRTQRAAHLGLGVVWVVANVQFWTWWLSRAQAGELWLAITVSAALAYQVSLLPTIFWWFLGRMR